LEKVPVSQLCEENDLQPTVFYRRQKEFFENGASAQPSTFGTNLGQAVRQAGNLAGMSSLGSLVALPGMEPGFEDCSPMAFAN
jgi:hypothetical protein